MQNLSSAAVVIGALRLNYLKLFCLLLQDVTPNMCKTEPVCGDAMLSQLAKMTVVITHLIVEFAKNLPGFTRISKEDQITLLKVSSVNG